MSMLGWLQQKIYSRLLPIGTVVWTIAAIIICAFDEKSFGVGAFIFITNTHLALSSLYQKIDIHKKLLNHNISMHCGAFLLLLMIFMRFGSSVFEPVEYQLSVFLVNFIFYLIYWIVVNIKESRI